MSDWSVKQECELLMTIILTEIPKPDWTMISISFGNNKSAGACRLHFSKLVKDKMLSLNGDTCGTNAEADPKYNDTDEDEDGTYIQVSSDESVSDESVAPVAKAAKHKANKTAKKGVKAKTGAKRKTRRGGKKLKKEIVKSEREGEGDEAEEIEEEKAGEGDKTVSGA